MSGWDGTSAAVLVPARYIVHPPSQQLLPRGFTGAIVLVQEHGSVARALRSTQDLAFGKVGHLAPHHHYHAARDYLTDHKLVSLISISIFYS